MSAKDRESGTKVVKVPEDWPISSRMLLFQRTAWPQQENPDAFDSWMLTVNVALIAGVLIARV